MELVEQLNAIAEPEGRAEIKARIGAWWHGKEFDREAYLQKVEEEEAAKAAIPPKIKPLDDGKKISLPPPRVAALETMWGRGRYVPGDGELDAMLIEAMGRVKGRIGKIGLLGVDAVSADVLAQAAGEAVELVEWRDPCVKRSSELTENARVSKTDLDRMNRFEDGSLKSMISIDALTYVDHKAGLCSRVYRALRDGGRWAVVDYSANPDFKSQTAFASAWAEPQLLHGENLQSTLETTGFKFVRRVDATRVVIEAVKAAFARLGPALEDVVAEGVGGRDAALMLQEVSWEAVAWRKRLNALETGQLRVDIWIVEKTGAISDDDKVEAAPAIVAGNLDEELFAKSENKESSSEPEDAIDGLMNTAPVEETSSDEESWDVAGADNEPEDAEEELDQSAVDDLFG